MIFLFRDQSSNSEAQTKISADNANEAILKAIDYMLTNEEIDVYQICECLDLELVSLDNLKEI